jgi:metal-dependent amidase/aminoacylase/carboxypeptidase family protein
MRGTFRTFSNDTMKQIEDCMRRTATDVAAAFGATANLD